MYLCVDRPDLLKLITRKVYVSKKSTPPSTPLAQVTDEITDGVTDGETDGSSDKDGSGSSETDFDFDFDFLNQDSGDDGEEFEFDKFDEIESSVERGCVLFVLCFCRPG